MRTIRRFLVACAACVSLSAFASDVDEARALFEKNIAAIRSRDKAAYLSCYLDSAQLVLRAGVLRSIDELRAIVAAESK